MAAHVPNGNDESDKTAEIAAWNQKQVHVPPWTNPSWQDHGPQRDASHYPVEDRVVDVLRPALRPSDDAEHPTRHARRFGIFPGRTDGRSCASPTRSLARPLPQQHQQDPQLTGKRLFEELEFRALLANQSLDNFMDSARRDPTRLKSYSFALSLYEELMLEEFWQSALFGEITMDELISGSHFSMGKCECNLDGPLFRFFRRDRWDPAPFGSSKHGPFNVYELDGRKGDFNPATNDELWAALQPCLQLATRIMQLDDPFYRALQDFNNWYLIDPALDTRPPQSPPRPLCKIEMREDKTGSLAQLAGVSPSSRFNPVACTLAVLESSLMLRVASCHENFEPGEKGPTLGGWFQAPWEFGLGCLGHLTVSAEGVWQLLSKKLSSAEKMMASFVTSVTLVHEFMHAWNRATMEWLCNPAYYGIDNPRDLRYCNAVKAILLPVDCSGGPEPFYKDDYRSELGAAFETHMIGTGIYGALSGPGQLRPPFLRQYYGMAVNCENNNGEELVKPKSRMGAHWISYERHSNIKKMFSKDYWDIVVAKYGSSVLRYRATEPRKAYLTEEHTLSFDQTFAELSFWTKKDNEWLSNFMAKLYHGGQQVLYRYCTLLVHDAHRFEFLLKKFVNIADQWSHNNKGIVNRLKALLMTVLEARIYYLCSDAISSRQSENPRLSTILDADPQRRPEAEAAWRRWCELETSVPAECQDQDSRKLKSLSFNLFYLEIAMQDDTFDERIVTMMMDVAILLDSEQQLSESMLCELYHLPTALWKNYLDGFPGHSLVWTARCHRFAYFLRHVARELFAMRSHLPSIGRGWMGRLKKWVEAFETVIDLMPGNTDKVAENWADLLRTVPMMRKSQRRSWERLFPIAKQAMLNLTGAQLKDMTRFQKKFQESMQLNSFKVVLPSKDPSAQGLAEHWAGILGTIVAFEMEQQQLMATLGRQLAKIELRRGVERAKAERERSQRAEEAAAGQLSQVQRTPSRKFSKQYQEALTIKSEIEEANNVRRERKLKYRSRLGLTYPYPSGTSSPLRSGRDARRSPMHSTPLTLRLSQRENQPRQEVAAQQAHIGVPRIAQPPDTLTGPSSSPSVPGGSDTRRSLQRMTAAFSSMQAPPVFTNVRDLAIHTASPASNHFLPAGNVHRPVPADYKIDGPSVIDELVTGVARDAEDVAAAAAAGGEIEAASQEAFAIAHDDMERHAAAHLEALAAAVKMHHVARDHMHREQRLTEELREVEGAAGGAMDVDGDVAMGEGDGLPQPSRMVNLCDKYSR